MKEPIIDMMMIVLNGEPFLEFNLKQHYKHFNKIWIVEGADNRTRDHVSKEFFTEDGHSTDSTIEIIKSFPDPDHKIMLIQHPNNTFWTGGKDEMIKAVDSKVLNNYNGLNGYLMEIDVDEFYKDEDLEKLFQIAEEFPQVTSYGIRYMDMKTKKHLELTGEVLVEGCSNGPPAHLGKPIENQPFVMPMALIQ
jgi:GT2 family glycosyltransferase